MMKFFEKKKKEEAKECDECKGALHLLGGTADVWFCPSCVIDEKRDNSWKKQHGLDGFPMFFGGKK